MRHRRLFIKEREHVRGFGKESDSLMNERGFLHEERIVGSAREVRFDRRADALRKFFFRNFPHPLALHPIEFIDVEDRSGFLDVLDCESFCQFFEWEDFLWSIRIPAEEGDEVHERFGEISLLNIVFDCDVPLSLTEFALVVIKNERQVCIPWRSPPEGTEEQEMLRERTQPLFSPNHDADVHEMVIDEMGQMVGRKAITL